jgi:hypothetical protein
MVTSACKGLKPTFLDYIPKLAGRTIESLPASGDAAPSRLGRWRQLKQHRVAREEGEKRGDDVDFFAGWR